jgi:hypothetical protein
VTRYLVEILLAASVLAVACVLAGSWWAVAAGAAGILLGFGLFRYMLAGKLYKTVFNATVAMQRGK